MADSLRVIWEARVSYVLTDRRDAAQVFAAQVATGPWRAIRTDRQTGAVLVEVQEVGREDGDRLLLVRSQGCRQKEQGIHNRLLTRLTEALARQLEGVYLLWTNVQGTPPLKCGMTT